jgi:hypothetical protein
LFFPDECREHPHHDDDHGNDCHSADDAADAGDQLVPRPRVHGCVQLKKRKLTVVFSQSGLAFNYFSGLPTMSKEKFPKFQVFAYKYPELFLQKIP